MIFLCGLACGAAGVNVYLHDKIVPAAAAPSVERLEDELHMTQKQRQVVDRELDEYAKYYQNIEEERNSVAELGKRNILRVLTPEQQKRFAQMFQFPAQAPCSGSSGTAAGTR